MSSQFTALFFLDPSVRIRHKTVDGKTFCLSLRALIAGEGPKWSVASRPWFPRETENAFADRVALYFVSTSTDAHPATVENMELEIVLRGLVTAPSW